MSSLYKPDSLEGYRELRRWLRSLKERGQMSEWGTAVRWYIENDLFYLVNDVLSDGKTINSETGRPLFFHDFYLQWCRDIEFQGENGGGFDASSRRSGKSTLRTKADNVRRMVRYPDSSGCIFSFQRKASRKHFRAIKTECENNVILKTVCDDIFFWDPIAAARNGETVWSVDDGIIVKRSVNRKELTLEYNAFMDGTPTGGGYDRLDFDDIEDKKAVGNQDQLEKLHSTYDSTINLLTPAVVRVPWMFFTNTFYHIAGLAKRVYDTFEEKDGRMRRIMPAEDLSTPGEGPMGGRVLYPFTPERLQRTYDNLRHDKTEYAIQFCCSFLAGEDRRLDPNWLIRYDEDPVDRAVGKNIYICIDPSRGVADPMAIWVWALGSDQSKSWVDASVKRLDPALPDFFDEILLMVAKMEQVGRIIEIRVEDVGQSTYSSQVRDYLRRHGKHYPVVRCSDVTGRTGKFDSIKRDREFERWARPAASGELFIPKPSHEGGKGLVRADENGHRRDLVKDFLEREWALFPKPMSDHMLDAGALLWEPPEKIDNRELQYPGTGIYRRITAWRPSRARTSFMSAG